MIALLAVAVVVAAVAVVLVVLVDVGKPEPVGAPPPTTTSPPPTTTSAKPKPKPPKQLPPALVVKIDNVAAARPHVGLASANLIYVEPVEGGLTRLLAVYWGRRPSVIGPVRSARETDIQLLAYMRRPVLAYSGAARRLIPALRAADLVHANPRTSGGFYRRGSRPMPHNMYVDPSRLPGTKRVAPPLGTGKAPAGGRRDNSHHVSYKAASYDFTWSRGGRKWRVSMDGRPLVSTEHGRLSASTVVVQRVRIVRGRGVRDKAGHRSPVARTVGWGSATVLRDGKRFEGTWSRPSAAQPPVYRMKGGTEIPLARGKVWVLLVPAR